MEGAVIGTAAYMSPEQAEGQAARRALGHLQLWRGAVRAAVGQAARSPATTTAQVRERGAARRAARARCAAGRRPDRAASAWPNGRSNAFRRCASCAPRSTSAATTADEQPSIVVLPFENMSGDKENEYFSDGLAEEIINALTRIPGTEGHRPDIRVRVQGQARGRPPYCRGAGRDEGARRAASGKPATASA